MANDPNSTHKLFTSRVKIPASQYIGESGRMFYDESTGCLRLSDGVTPGGIPACGNSGGGGSGVSDHGLLVGLLDDDHPQYHNDARGDIRYYTKTQLNAGQLNNLYYTETEVNNLLLGKSNTTHLHTGVYEPANANIQQHISSTSNPHSVTANQVLPSQAGQAGYYLTTNGTTVSWATVAASTAFGTKTGDIVISAGQTVAIDTTTFTTYGAAKWLITVTDAANTKLQSYEVRGQYLAGQPGPTHSIASNLGDKIHNVVSLATTATTMTLHITNNEAYSIVVRSAKYDITS